MSIDTQIFYLLNNLAGQSPLGDRIIVFFANDLAYILVALFASLLFFSAYTRKKKLELFLVSGISSAIAGLALVPLIRFFYHHPRPFDVLQVHKLLVETSWSFPSRHSAFFFALATAIYLYNKKWGSWFIVATVLMTAARVAAGVHYPSDIAGGAILGALVAYSTFRIAKLIQSKTTHQTY